MKERYTIGIDAGGTYTDAVLVSAQSRQVIASAKRPTSHHNLSLGMEAAMAAILQDNTCVVSAKDIELVTVSTTLATNAVVENSHDAVVALIVIGWSNRMDIPGTSHVRHVPGGHKIDGSEQEEVNFAAIVDAIGRLKGQVDAYAVCGLMSFINPAHEQLVAKAIAMIDPKPVFCSHTVSRRAGMKERATTAVLNARLLPVMQDFLDGVKGALCRLDIQARVSVVRGDATVMSLEDAVQNAAATVASGPAATALFGSTAIGRIKKNEEATTAATRHLTTASGPAATALFGSTALREIERNNEESATNFTQDALIVDVGGTTTDVTLLRHRKPVIAENGLVIGAWVTHVRAVEMFTVGIGGDSHVHYHRGSKNKASKIRVGPRRVTPLCMAPNLDTLEAWLFAPDGGTCLMACEKETRQKTMPSHHSSDAKRLLECLENNGPMDHSTACNKLGMARITLERAVEHLLHHQLVAEIGFTPTDALHAVKLLDFGDADQAIKGVHILAKLMACTEQEAIDTVLHTTQQGIEDAIVEHVARREVGANFAGYLQQRRSHSLLRVQLGLAVPIVGIGAAARYLLAQVGQNLATSCIFPEYYEVGNALGAALLGLDTCTNELTL